MAACSTCGGSVVGMRRISSGEASSCPKAGGKGRERGSCLRSGSIVEDLFLGIVEVIPSEDSDTWLAGVMVDEEGAGGSEAVMDMVIFRTIFFELFSFLHVHAPYHPFRLLTNLGIHRRQDKALLFVRPIDNGTQREHVILLSNCPGTPPKTPPPSHPLPPARE